MGKGKEKITCKSMHKPLKPLAKLHCSSVVFCAQSPARARLQGFLAEDLPNNRMDSVFRICDPPCSERRMFNHVIFSGVLTDLFFFPSFCNERKCHPFPKASIGARKYIYFFVHRNLAIRKCVLIRTMYLKFSWSMRGET